MFYIIYKVFVFFKKMQKNVKTHMHKITETPTMSLSEHEKYDNESFQKKNSDLMTKSKIKIARIVFPIPF